MNSKNLAKSVIGSAGIKISYVLLQFLVSVILARSLGPKSFGDYAVIMALVQLMSVMAQLGLPRFLIRMVGVLQGRGELPLLKGLAVFTIQAVSLASLFLIVVAAYLLKKASGDSVLGGAYWALLLIPLFSFGAAATGALQGLDKVLLSQLPDQIIRPSIFLAVFCAALMVIPVATPAVAIGSQVLSAFFATGFAIWATYKSLPQQALRIAPTYDRATWTQAATPFFLLAGAQILNYQADIIMLGTFAAKEDVGHYRVAVQLVDGVSVLLYAISVVIAPKIVRLHSEKNWNEIRKILVAGHRVAVLIMVPTAIFIYFFGASILGVIFGKAYLDAATPLELLMLGKIAYATTCFSGLALSMVGKAGLAFYISAISLILNIGLNYFLIPKYGASGAAVASSISQFFVNILGIVYFSKYIGADVSVFGVGKKFRKKI